MKKKIGKLVAILLLSMLVYISFNVISICTYSKVYSDKECDVAIVLGAACSNSKVSEVYKQRLNQSNYMKMVKLNTSLQLAEKEREIPLQMQQLQKIILLNVVYQKM